MSQCGNHNLAGDARIPRKRRRDDPKRPRKRAKPRATSEHSALSAKTSRSPIGTCQSARLAKLRLTTSSSRKLS